MKRISSLVFFLLLFTSISFAGGQPELYVKIYNLVGGSLTFTLTRINANAYCFPWQYRPLTNNFKDCNTCFPAIGTLSRQCTSCADSIVTISILPGAYGTSGFSFCWDESGDTYPKIGYGLYKLTNNFDGSYFYIDTRDCDYANQGSPSGYLDTVSADTYIRYYYGQPSNKAYAYSFKSVGDSIPIKIGGFLNIWEGDKRTMPNTNYFPSDFWEKSFSVFANEDLHSNPHLSWGAFPSNSGTVTEYQIYRAVTNNSTDPMPALHFFTLISTVGPSTFSYIDSLYYHTDDLHRAYYYIKAMHNTSILALSPGKWLEVSDFVVNKNQPLTDTTKRTSLQNYPNPFNPVTKITFTISEKSKVMLKIFDTFGREVTTLFDGIREAGNYEVFFDATSKNLASGNYYYQLVQGTKTIVGKMTLIK